MKKIIVLIFITLISCGKKSEEKRDVISGKVKVIDTEYIASKTVYFKVQNDSIIGEGNNVFRDIFNNSQFVMFGERHNSKETSKLIKALIPIMNNADFKTACLEIGPHSAKKIVELSSNPEKTVENLASFNTKYGFESSESGVPIPFFEGVEDADFLKSMSKNNMEIWGVDQEYFYSILYLTDELLKKVESKNNFEVIKRDKEKADKVILKWFEAGANSKEEIDVFSEIQKEEIVITFFNHFIKNKEASEIIKDLKISWDIYSRWRQGSHVDRISYMRNNFLDNFNKKSADTKVFLKFGQLHASQIISNGAYDIGNLVNEIAKKNKTNATNINSWTRFYKEDSLEIDYLKKYEKYYKRLKPFMDLGKRDEWTLIDLKSIREDVLNKKVELPKNGDFHKINQLLQGYDYQLILPLDEYITINKN